VRGPCGKQHRDEHRHHRGGDACRPASPHLVSHPFQKHESLMSETTSRTDGLALAPLARNARLGQTLCS
jgi:hypothetical protein